MQVLQEVQVVQAKQVVQVDKDTSTHKIHQDPPRLTNFVDIGSYSYWLISVDLMVDFYWFWLGDCSVCNSCLKLSLIKNY